MDSFPQTLFDTTDIYTQVVLLVHMRPKCISGVFLIISLLLSCAFVSAVSFDEFSFHLNSAPKPPLALTGASIDCEEGMLIHDNVYQITVQVANTRSHKVDGRVEVAAFSLLQAPIVIGYETIDLEPDENTSLLFTFSPAFPCANYIFMATTDPNSATHINERDYIFVDERREFALTDCAEKVEEEIEKDEASDINSNADETSVTITTAINSTKNSENETKNEVETVIIPLQTMQAYNSDVVLDLPTIVHQNENHAQPFTIDIEENNTILKD